MNCGNCGSREASLNFYPGAQGRFKAVTVKPVIDENGDFFRQATYSWPTLITVVGPPSSPVSGLTLNFVIQSGDATTYKYWEVRKVDPNLTNPPLLNPENLGTIPVYRDPSYPTVTLADVNAVATPSISYINPITAPDDAAMFWDALAYETWTSIDFASGFGFLDTPVDVGSGFLTGGPEITIGRYIATFYQSEINPSWSIHVEEATAYRFVFQTPPTCKLTINWDEVISVTRDDVTTDTVTQKTWTWVPPAGTCLQLVDGAPDPDHVYSSSNFTGPTWTSADYNTSARIANVYVDYST